MQLVLIILNTAVFHAIVSPLYIYIYFAMMQGKLLDFAGPVARRHAYKQSYAHSQPGIIDYRVSPYN